MKSNIVTKEEERKALEKIIKILDYLGGVESYVRKAFEGCIKLAEENIENGFMISYLDKIQNITYLYDEEKASKKRCENQIKVMQSELDSYKSLKTKLIAKSLEPVPMNLKDLEILKQLLNYTEEVTKEKARNNLEYMIEHAETFDSQKEIQGIANQSELIGRIKECHALQEKVKKMLESAKILLKYAKYEGYYRLTDNITDYYFTAPLELLKYLEKSYDAASEAKIKIEVKTGGYTEVMLSPTDMNGMAYAWEKFFLPDDEISNLLALIID